MAQAESLSVVIPTFQRPTWLRRAVGSLAVQAPAPDEVVAVARDTDLPTHEVLDDLLGSPLPFRLRRAIVSEAGFMPPVRTGLATAEADVVAVMDDDAEAQEGWVARLLSHYDSEDVGAVGGRCINMKDDRPVDVPAVDRVGYVNRRGQFVGNMYCRPTFDDPVDVDFMLGGNMSFRRDIARRLEFDMELNRNVAQGYEVDIGLQVKGMGWRILFDPLLAIRHYSAPRAAVGLRATDNDGVQWYSYNHARVALRRLPALRRSISIAYQFAVGERKAPGLLPWMAAPLARRFGFEDGVAKAALTGRVLALRSVLGGGS